MCCGQAQRQKPNSQARGTTTTIQKKSPLPLNQKIANQIVAQASQKLAEQNRQRKINPNYQSPYM